MKKTISHLLGRCMNRAAAVALVALFILAGCRSGKNKDLVVVERQNFKLEGISDFYSAEFVVDVPISAPQPLYDSLKSYLNRELHYAVELVLDTTYRDSSQIYKAEEVYTDDMMQFADHYFEKYRDYSKRIENGYGLHLFVVDQNNAFVTYGLEFTHCGGSCGSEFIPHTFSKKDGHQLTDIITLDNLVKYLREHPDEDSLYLYYEMLKDTEDDEPALIELPCGLMSDGLVLATNYYSNHYRTLFFPYDDIMPYLSDEAREYVEGIKRDESSADWFLGDRVGTVTTGSGRTILLDETPSAYEYYNFFIEADSSVHDIMGAFIGTGCTLTAYYAEGGVYKPAKVFEADGESRSKLEPNWDYACRSREGSLHALDKESGVLYSPMAENLQMGSHDFCDRYDTYKFDGEKFVYQGEDGGFWIHPSVRSYAGLTLMFNADGEESYYIVRIDAMRKYDLRDEEQYEASRSDTCVYRYVAWAEGAEMSDEPAIVIEGGCYDGRCYKFERDDGYKYIVDTKDMVMYVYRDEEEVENDDFFYVAGTRDALGY